MSSSLSPSPSSLESWYAVYVRSRQEGVVEKQLRSRQVEVYVPRREERRRWSDRVKTVAFPLFPGYVFVYSEMSSAARVQILSCRGVVQILQAGGRPAPIPEEEIFSVQRMVESQRPLETLDLVPVGTRVRIVQGPLKDVEGVVLEHRNARKIVCSIGLLGRSVAAELHPDDVWPEE